MKGKWRQNLRREIEREAVATRASLASAKELALRKKRLVRDDQNVPREANLTIAEELECIGYALTHMQEAENRFGQLRMLLTRYRERLESEREIELAHPELVAIEFTNGSGRKTKRPGRGQIGPAVQAAWARLVADEGEPTTSWGVRLAHHRIGEEIHVSESTVRKYLRPVEVGEAK